MRTQKEIARYVEADAKRNRIKLSKGQKKAHIAICFAREIHRDIEVVLEDIKKSTSNLTKRLDVLEEKIITSPEEEKQRLHEYATEVKRIVSELDLYNINYEDFTVLDRLLATLEVQLKGYHWRKNWTEINRVAKELKLGKLIKSNKAAVEIGDFLKRALEKMYEGSHATYVAGESYEQERTQLKKVYETARSLVPHGTTEEDIIRRIREKGAGASDATVTITATSVSGNLTTNFA